MVGINKSALMLDLETIFTRVQADINGPKALGRGEIIAVILQNPLLTSDGVTTNNSQIWVGGGSVRPYLMIPGQESPILYAEDLKDIYLQLLFPFPNPNGGILTAAVSAAVGGAGAGYTAGDVLTLSPGAIGSNATITVLTVGGPLTAGTALNAGGAGYVVGNVLSVIGGNGLGRIVVDTVDGAGAILTFHISVPGDNYVDTAGNAVAGGAGAGATFNTVTTHKVMSIAITTPGTGFVAGNAYNAAGGTGAGAVIIPLTVQTLVAESADITCIIYRWRKGGKQ